MRKVGYKLLQEIYLKSKPICDCYTSGKTFWRITNLLHIWGKNVWSMNIHRTWTIDVIRCLAFPLISPVLKPDFHLQLSTIKLLSDSNI